MKQVWRSGVSEVVKMRIHRNVMACLLGFIGNCPPPMEPLGVALQRMGLVEMRSPREIWPIGTVVAVKRDQSGNIIEVPDVCNTALMDPSVVREGKSYRQERTGQISKLEDASTSGGLALNGISINDVKAGLGADGQYIAGISLTISNAWIFYADDVVLSVTVDALVRDPRCADAIDRRRKAGYEITALEKVLVADLTYTVNLSGNVSGEVKATLLKQVGAQLRATYDEHNQTLIRGGGLTFGFSVVPAGAIPPSLRPAVPTTSGRSPRRL
jgi:hypothetical protein